MTLAEQTAEVGLGASSFKSVPDMWHHRCHSTPDSEAMIFRRGDEWASMTWREAEERARRIANGLLSLGLQPEERCVIIADTSVEWILVDMGILCAGGATTTIFPTSQSADCEYVINDCDARYVFCDSQIQVDKIAGCRKRIGAVRNVIVFRGRPSPDGWVRTLAELEEEGRAFATEHPQAYRAAHANIEPDRLATLMYTSGTTGEPKGVMLSHDSWVYEAAAIDAMGMISPADKQYLFLPLSHVFAKVMQVIFIRLGVPTVVDGDNRQLLDHLEETHPTWMGAVPRIFERAYNEIVRQAQESGRVRYRVFRWALEVGREVSRLRQKGRSPRGLLRVRYALAQKLVFSRIKQRFGGRIRFLISGAAPLSPEIAEFFHACDILILEGYGLTESSAASCVNWPDDFTFGTVGKPVPGTTIRIDEDGEVLLRSRGVMTGYYRRPEDTEQALYTDANGDTWLRTGDIGTMLKSGHLKITGRKKDIIVTAGGKNVPPAHFQNLLKARSRFVSQVVVHGDKRPYLVALVTINEDAVGKFVRDNGGSFSGYADLAAKPEVKALVQAAVDVVNKDLPAHETVKKIAILPEDLTIENGALTPSLKVKRRVVEERYKDLLDGFYEGSVRAMD